MVDRTAIACAEIATALTAGTLAITIMYHRIALNSWPKYAVVIAKAVNEKLATKRKLHW